MALLFSTASMFVAADEDTLTYDRINLGVSAGREVENDTLVAVLYAQEEGNSAAQLADQVNRRIESAVKKAKQTPGIKVQTLDYSTNPVYRKQVLTGWRVRRSIRLESRDSAVLGELIGALQERLSVSNISYTVSPERRKQVEETLISEAITAFTKRAKRVSGELNRPGYRLVEMRINSAGPPIRPRMMRTMAAEGVSFSAAPPVIEAGTQRLEISINGTIELKP
jgi:predicted secreted protein